MDNVVDIILYVCFFVNSDEDCFKCFSFGCVQIATSKAVLFEKNNSGKRSTGEKSLSGCK